MASKCRTRKVRCSITDGWKSCNPHHEKRSSQMDKDCRNWDGGTPFARPILRARIPLRLSLHPPYTKKISKWVYSIFILFGPSFLPALAYDFVRLIALFQLLQVNAITGNIMTFLNLYIKFHQNLSKRDRYPIIIFTFIIFVGK